MRWLPAGYLAVVVAVALTRALTGSPTTRAFALTPDRLAHGKVWLFATSALIANGPPLPQLAGLIPAIASAQRRLGAGFTNALMVAAHVGATLATYGLLALVSGDADGAHNRNLDYGVSAVWLGALGALWAIALRPARAGHRKARVAAIAGPIVLALSIALFPLLAATEHGFAFAIGAAAPSVSARRAQARLGRLDPAHPRRAHELRRPKRRAALDVEADSVAVLDSRDGA